MKKHFIYSITIVILIAIVSFSGCKKADDNPASSPQSTTPSYNLRFTCTSSNPYLIEINGNSNVVQGNSYKDYTLEKGTYYWKVTQQSGYLVYPTVQDGNITLDQDKEITFP